MTSKDFKGSIFVEFENQETAERVCHIAACCDAAHLPEGLPNACVLCLSFVPSRKPLRVERGLTPEL